MHAIPLSMNLLFHHVHFLRLGLGLGISLAYSTWSLTDRGSWLIVGPTESLYPGVLWQQ